MRAVQPKDTQGRQLHCLHSRQLVLNEWENVFPVALYTMRSLFCTATNETPHSRLFNDERHSGLGCFLPTWLAIGNRALLRKHVPGEKHPVFHSATVCDVLSPHYSLSPVSALTLFLQMIWPKVPRNATSEPSASLGRA